MDAPIDWTDPSTYYGIIWSETVQNTVSDGVPAHGDGLFTCGCACLWWMLSFIGISGCQRRYLGDTCCCIFYCLTAGVFGFGQLIDLCLMKSKVEQLNSEIRAQVYRKRQSEHSRQANNYNPTMFAPVGYVTPPVVHAVVPTVVPQVAAAAPVAVM